jgi:hypothetical protein
MSAIKMMSSEAAPFVPKTTMPSSDIINSSFSGWSNNLTSKQDSESQCRNGSFNLHSHNSSFSKYTDTNIKDSTFDISNFQDPNQSIDLIGATVPELDVASSKIRESEEVADQQTKNSAHVPLRTAKYSGLQTSPQSLFSRKTLDRINAVANNGLFSREQQKSVRENEEFSMFKNNHCENGENSGENGHNLSSHSSNMQTSNIQTPNMQNSQMYHPNTQTGPNTNTNPIQYNPAHGSFHQDKMYQELPNYQETKNYSDNTRFNGMQYPAHHSNYQNGDYQNMQGNFQTNTQGSHSVPAETIHELFEPSNLPIRLERELVDKQHLINENNQLRRALANPESLHEKWVDPSLNYLFTRMTYELKDLKTNLNVYEQILGQTLCSMLSKNTTQQEIKDFCVQNYTQSEVKNRISMIVKENSDLKKAFGKLPYELQMTKAQIVSLNEENENLRLALENNKQLVDNLYNYPDFAKKQKGNEVHELYSQLIHFQQLQNVMERKSQVDKKKAHDLKTQMSEMELRHENMETAVYDNFKVQMGKVQTDCNLKLRNSKQYFDSFMTDLVRHDQSVLPFITNWFGKTQEEAKPNNFEANQPSLNKSSSGQTQGSSGQSLNNSLNSHESGSQQASTNQNITRWAQFTDEELSSNTLEFLDKAFSLDHPETQIYPNNQLYQDSQKVTNNLVQVFNKYWPYVQQNRKMIESVINPAKLADQAKQQMNW